jgi:hypothetical protein
MQLRRLVIALATSTALLTSFTPAASAGTYDVLACNSAGGVNHSWAYETNAPNALESLSSCPSTGSYTGLVATTNLNRPAPPTFGDFGQWVVRAPSETRISRAQLARWLGMEGGSGWEVYARTDDGQILSGETCTVTPGNDECNVGGFNAPGLDRTLDTTSLAYGVRCIRSGCTTGFTIHAARAAIYSARVTITDEVAPTLGVPGGSLLTPTGYHRGSEIATFTASDSSGIGELRLYADGLLRVARSHQCDYTLTAPCSSSSDPQSVAFDTRLVPDGDRQVQVGAVDAAGNETRSVTRTITVDNGAPAAPQGLTVASRDMANPGFSASWRNPGGQVAPIERARWVLCPADGGACSSGAVAGGGGAGRLDGSLPRPGRWTLAVYLVDAAGNASTGNASQVELDYAVPSPPASVPPAVAPSPPPPAAKRSPRLAVASARLDRRRRTVIVRGTLARSARGRLTVTHRARVGRRTVTRAVAVAPRRGRFTARVRISAKEARGRSRQVRVSYPGAGAYAPASRTVRVR